MTFKFLLNRLFLVLLCLIEINAYGRLMDPVNRGSAWRLGFNTPINYQDTTNNCGGFSVQHVANNGQCGVCGDNYTDKKPRSNENNGTYGKGTIVRNYTEGDTIELQVELTANLNGGTFDFSICDLYHWYREETEECFQFLTLADGGRKHRLTNTTKTGYHNFTVKLPPSLTCNHCVIRWQYIAANNWGICSDGTGKLGCGPQETFRTCSDVAIFNKPTQFSNILFD